MKIFSFASVLFFGYMCFKYYNEPEMAYWMGVYGSMMACSLFTLFFRPGRNYLVLPLAIGGAALIGGLLILPEFQLFLNDGGLFNIYSSEYAEEGRKFLGLMVVILASLLEMGHIYQNSKGQD